MLNSRSSIPQEITDEIIDHSYHDTHSLATFALVSKSWLPRSRFHLFEEVCISPTNVRDFLAILDSPKATICPYVRCLTMAAILDDPSEPWVNHVIHRLAALEAITSLCFDRVKWETLEGDGAAAKLATIFPGVVELQIIDVKFDSFTHFTDLICAFPCLEKIAITFGEDNETLFPSRDLSSFTQHRLPTRLRCLRFPRCPPNVQVLQWIVSLASVQVPLIDAVAFSFISSMQLPAIGSFLKTIGPTLKYLGLSFNYDQVTFINDFRRNVDLGYNCDLRSINFYNLDQEVPWIPHILAQISSPSMTTIFFHVFLHPKNLLQSPDWSALDSLLSGPRFQRVETMLFSFSLGDWSNSDAAESWVRKMLPACSDRGILKFS